MWRSILACCKLYISESWNKAALESIERAAKLFSDAPIINRFVDDSDDAYNRVGYTLVSNLSTKQSSSCCSLRGAVLAMVKAAFVEIDLELHSGGHPRLGVVDHICFHPLGLASLDEAAAIAKALAGDIGSGLRVPTILCGAAHEEGRKLATIRRKLDYFKANAHGSQWIRGPKSESLLLKPEAGPGQAS